MHTLQNKPLLWITDPWDTLFHETDTTVRLMNECVRLGIPTYWSSSDFILNSSNLTRILVTDFVTKTQVEIEPSKFHQLHYRLDPPVDFNYISLLDQLVSRGAQNIFSPPQILKFQSEKLPPVELAHLTPRGCVLKDPIDVMKAQTLFVNDEKVVSKPLNEAQSKGVASWETPRTEESWLFLAQKVTHGFTQPILIQEFLPEINQGEVRMWFANGEFIAALKKYPKTGDFRVLIDEGSKVEAYHLNASEQIAAQQVGAVLKKQNVKLAAVDFIQGKISDYNVTSPGLLVQLEKVHGGKNFAREILQKIL